MFKPTSNYLKPYEYIFFIVLAAPMLYLNVRHSVHWGDDFAVYINQALNILNAHPFDTTTYHYINGFSSLAPSAPVGFSILLVPALKLFGFNIHALVLYMSLLFIVWMFVSYMFLRQHFQAPACLVIVFIAFYSNFMLWVKLLVTSDVPFAAMFVLLVILMGNLQTGAVARFIALGCLAGFAITTRSVGVIIIPAIWLYVLTTTSIYRFAQIRNNKAVYNACYVTASALLTYLVFNSLLFKPVYSYVNGGLAVWHFNQLPATLIFNLKHYANAAMELFTSTAAGLKGVSTVVKFAVMLTICAGMILKWIRHRELFDYVVLCYLIFILSFPVFSDYRYLLPVHVFLMYYLFYPLTLMFQRFSYRIRFAALAAIFVLVAVQYTDHLTYLIKHTHETVPGPYEDIASETFKNLNQVVPDGAIMAFNKPRALALFTHKNTTMFNWELSPELNYKRLCAENVTYYLYDWAISDEVYQSLIEKNKYHFKEVYKNWQFVLYKDTLPQCTAPQ